MDLSPARVLARLTEVARLDKSATLDQHGDSPAPDGFREAAVIAPLVARGGALHLIFNKRAANLDNHPGQVSFPGGRRDPEDASLLANAQRELAEELGLRARPLCRLPARKVISHYYVTPFVSLVDPAARIIADPGEVAYAFEVPLAFLGDPANAAGRKVDVFGEAHTFYSWEYQGETIWGATGRMVADLLGNLGATHLDP